MIIHELVIPSDVDIIPTCEKLVEDGWVESDRNELNIPHNIYTYYKDNQDCISFSWIMDGIDDIDACGVWPGINVIVKISHHKECGELVDKYFSEFVEELI